MFYQENYADCSSTIEDSQVDEDAAIGITVTSKNEPIE